MASGLVYAYHIEDIVIMLGNIMSQTFLQQRPFYFLSTVELNCSCITTDRDRGRDWSWDVFNVNANLLWQGNWGLLTLGGSKLGCAFL